MSRHGKLSVKSARVQTIMPVWVRDELQLLANAETRKLSAFIALKLKNIVTRKKNTPKLAIILKTNPSIRDGQKMPKQDRKKAST